MFDWRTDSEVEIPVQAALPEAVLLFEGVFLQRPELDGSWELTIWVEAEFDVTVARAEDRARKDGSGALGLRGGTSAATCQGRCFIYANASRASEQTWLSTTTISPIRS